MDIRVCACCPGRERSIVYFEGFLQDITERKQIENAEREQCLLTEALRHTAESLNSTLEYGEVLDQILATVGNVVPSDPPQSCSLTKGWLMSYARVVIRNAVSRLRLWSSSSHWRKLPI